MLMAAETVLLPLTSEQRAGFDLTWGYRSGTGTVFPPSACAVCPCQIVLSVHRDSTTRAACPSVRCLCTGTVCVLSVPVSSICLCTGTVRVLSVPVSSFCLCTGTVRVLSVPVSSFCLCTGTVRVLSVHVSSLSVHRDSMCAACPCQFVLSVHRDITCAVCPCQFVLPVHRDSMRAVCSCPLSVLHPHSFMYHRHGIVLPIESAIKQ